MKKLLLILSIAGFFTLNGQNIVPNQVSVYPNPAVSSVDITFTEQVKSDITVTISDILGNRIQTLKFSPDATIHIDLSALELKNGLYLIKVETSDQSFLKRLVVKS